MTIKVLARFYKSKEDLNASTVGIEPKDYDLKPTLINPAHISHVVPTIDNTGIVVYMICGGDLTLNTTIEDFNPIWDFALKAGIYNN